MHNYVRVCTCTKGHTYAQVLVYIITVVLKLYSCTEPKDSAKMIYRSFTCGLSRKHPNYFRIKPNELLVKYSCYIFICMSCIWIYDYKYKVFFHICKQTSLLIVHVREVKIIIIIINHHLKRRGLRSNGSCCKNFLQKKKKNKIDI